MTTTNSTYMQQLIDAAGRYWDEADTSWEMEYARGVEDAVKHILTGEVPLFFDSIIDRMPDNDPV